MPRWEVVISDTVTGKLISGSERFTAGVHVTSSPQAAEYLSSMDPRLVRVRELAEGEEPGQTYENTAPEGPKGPLTVEDMRKGKSPQAKESCAQCGVEFANLDMHGAQSGHEVRPPQQGESKQDGKKRGGGAKRKKE